MTDVALYWYCPSITSQVNTRVSEAVFLSPILVFDIVESFIASLLDGQSIVPVESRIAGVTEVASSEDEDGNPVTLYNDERLPRSSLEALALPGQMKLHLDADAELSSGPALLTTDLRARFRFQSLEVELVADTIAQLPDFRAHMVYLRWFEDRAFSRSDGRPPSMLSDELQSAAPTLSLHSGMVLPVNGPGDDAEHPRVLVLGPQFSASPQRFAASLYSFYDIGVVQPGTSLSRTVRWLKDPEQRTWAGPIGRVLRTAG